MAGQTAAVAEGRRAGRLGRALVAFGAGWWVAAAVASLGVVVLATLDPTTSVPIGDLPFVPLVSSVVPGVVPVVLAWQLGVGSGVVRLPPECAGSTAGECHGIGWGIAATGLVAGIVLVLAAWAALPVGLYLDARRGDGPGLSRAGWLIALVPYAAGVVGLSYLARRYGVVDGQSRGRLRAAGTAVGAYLAVAAVVFVLALVAAVGSF